MDSDEDLLTTRDVAEMIDRTPRTVVRLVTAGIIPCTLRLARVRGIYLIRRGDVNDYLASCR